MEDSKYFPRRPLQRNGFGNIYSLDQRVFYIYSRENAHFLYLILFIWGSYCHFYLDFSVCATPPTKRATGFPNKATVSCLSPHVIMAGLCVREPRKQKNHDLFWKVSCLSAWRNVRTALVTHTLKVEGRVNFGLRAFQLTGLTVKVANESRACIYHHSLRTLSFIWRDNTREMSSVSVLSCWTACYSLSYIDIIC